MGTPVVGKKKILELATILEKNQSLEFIHNNLFYELFESSEGGYEINVYISSQKDEDGCYLDENCIDGGFCTGTAIDAVEFMI